jgi:hypothetical protein
MLPMKQSIEFEVMAIKNMLQAKGSMSEYSYLKTIIFLTQARS